MAYGRHHDPKACAAIPVIVTISKVLENFDLTRTNGQNVEAM